MLSNLLVTLVGRLEGNKILLLSCQQQRNPNCVNGPRGKHAETMCVSAFVKNSKLSNGSSGACFASRLYLIKGKYLCIVWRFNFKASQEVCFFLLIQSRHSVPRTGKCSTLAAEFSWLLPTDTDSTWMGPANMPSTPPSMSWTWSDRCLCVSRT